MSEQQNCPTSVHVFGESNAGPTKNNYCQDRTESISEISKSVRILSEFRYIYEERLRKIDEETGGKGMELKLKTLTSWVNDLGEQNLMLVETVEQLEREAAGRVALLEERLRKSSHVALEYMSKLQEYDNQIWDLSEGKTVPMVLPYKASNGLVQAQQTEEILKTRVSNLQNDISGLLELIRRVRYEGSWDTNGLGFLEVTYEDIFGSYPHQAPCDTPKPVVFDASVSPKMTFGNHELDSASWRQKNNFGTEEIEDLNKKLEDVNSHLQETMKENERLVKEIGFLSAELKSKTDKITALSQNTSEIDKILKHTRESLTEEINEKQRQLVALKQCMFQLERRVQEADIQTYFKDAIIREMRKDIRIAQTKLASQEKSQMWCIHVDDNEVKCEANGRTAVPCPCPFQRNKFHLLLHQANQACSVSKSTPASCCTSLNAGNLSTLSPFPNEKEIGKQTCIISRQLLRTPFQQAKTNSFGHSPLKSGHNNNNNNNNNKKLRERIRMKTISDVYVPKEPVKHFPLCGVGNKLDGRAWMGGQTCPIELFQNSGDSDLNAAKNNVADGIKQKCDLNSVNYGTHMIHKCVR